MATGAARRLWTLGARPGARVAVVMAPSTEWVVTWHALQRLGAVAAPLDHRATPAETEDRLAALDPALVLRDPGEDRGGHGVRSRGTRTARSPGRRRLHRSHLGDLGASPADRADPRQPEGKRARLGGPGRDLALGPVALLHAAASRRRPDDPGALCDVRRLGRHRALRSRAHRPRARRAADHAGIAGADHAGAPPGCRSGARRAPVGAARRRSCLARADRAGARCGVPRRAHLRADGVRLPDRGDRPLGGPRASRVRRHAVLPHRGPDQRRGPDRHQGAERRARLDGGGRLARDRRPRPDRRGRAPACPRPRR